MSASLRVVVNPGAAAQGEAYGPDRANALPAEAFAQAHAEIASWPGYAPTPLLSLPALAQKSGLAAIHYKDEGPRFGLDSFKALGGAYAVFRVIARELSRRGVAEHVTLDDLVARRHAAHVCEVTVTSATDGNHGRSVAWGARMLGCRAVIFIHATVSESRRAAIAGYGAEVVRTAGGYDDSVRHAFAEALRHGWHVVQDTARGDYREVPADITSGYGVIAAEIMDQMVEPPTHALVQAGVGGLASAICAQFWIGWGARRPRFIVLEPAGADCVFQSIEAGRQVVVTGDLETVMAGLSCGEVSDLAWEILKGGADAAIAIDDAFALDGMRALADPAGGDPPVVGGECSGGAVGALLALAQRPELMAMLGLDRSSRVLLIGTEGATDPEIYTRVVGRSAADVRAQRR